MGNDNELRVLTELADHLGKLSYVGIIKWCVHLVEDTEGCRLDQVDGKQQGGSRQGTFSPAELADGAGPFSFWLGHNIDPCIGKVVWVLQDQVALVVFRKESLKYALEVLTHPVKSVKELLVCRGLHFCNGMQQALLRIYQVVLLLYDKLV